MRYFIITSIILSTIGALAQTDSSGYNIQRVRINNLLEKRSANFAQYDKSLTQRSGIFGLQTKKDLRNSNEILRGVVLNDNQIFRELKALMDYKDLKNKVEKVESAGHSARIKGYMVTIKKLQDEQAKLKTKIAEGKSSQTGFITALFGIILGSVTTIGILKFKRKADE